MSAHVLTPLRYAAEGPSLLAEEKGRWSLSLLVSLLLHLLLFSLITVEFRSIINPDKQPPPPPPAKELEVVWFDSAQSAASAPAIADAVSNINSEGGNLRANQDMRQAHRLPRHQQSPYAASKPTPPGEIDPPTPRKLDLRLSQGEMERISRTIEQEQLLASQNKREMEIPVNTTKVEYAPYVHDLVRVLEEQWRPGKLDYSRYSPAERRVYMQITINAKGDLEKIEMLQPSTIESMNSTAIAAVHAATPFKPLPRSWNLDRAFFKLVFEVVDDRPIFRGF